MHKVKSFFWLLLAALILIVFFSNLDFFLESQQMKLNFILKTYPLPPLPTAILCLFFFTVGLLIAYLSHLPERFRLRKTIKNMKTTIDAQEKSLATLRTYPTPAGADSATAAAEKGEQS